MNRKVKLRMRDVHDHVTCFLCDGYFIDATTIVECLHSFCRTCIVTHLTEHKHCPVCRCQVHKTRPLLNIRHDQTLQDIVYTLVPELRHNEMRRRRRFWNDNKDKLSLGNWTPEELGETDQSAIAKLSTKTCLSIEPVKFLKNQLSDASEWLELDRPIAKRYIRCSHDVTVLHLHKFVRMKLKEDDEVEILLFHGDSILPQNFTLYDVMETFPNAPTHNLALTFAVFTPKLLKRKPVLADVTDIQGVAAAKKRRLPSATPQLKAFFNSQMSPSLQKLPRKIPVDAKNNGEPRVIAVACNEDELTNEKPQKEDADKNTENVIKKEEATSSYAPVKPANNKQAMIKPLSLTTNHESAQSSTANQKAATEDKKRFAKILPAISDDPAGIPGKKQVENLESYTKLNVPLAEAVRSKPPTPVEVPTNIFPPKVKKAAEPLRPFVIPKLSVASPEFKPQKSRRKSSNPTHHAALSPMRAPEAPATPTIPPLTHEHLQSKYETVRISAPQQQGQFILLTTQASNPGAPAQPQARHGGAPVQPKTNHGGAPSQPQARHAGTPTHPQARRGGAPEQPQNRHGGAPAQPQARHGGAPAQPLARHGGAPAQPQVRHGGGQQQKQYERLEDAQVHRVALDAVRSMSKEGLLPSDKRPPQLKRPILPKTSAPMLIKSPIPPGGQQTRNIFQNEKVTYPMTSKAPVAQSRKSADRSSIEHVAALRNQELLLKQMVAAVANSRGQTKDSASVTSHSGPPPPYRGPQAITSSVSSSSARGRTVPTSNLNSLLTSAGNTLTNQQPLHRSPSNQLTSLSANQRSQATTSTLQRISSANQRASFHPKHVMPRHSSAPLMRNPTANQFVPRHPVQNANPRMSTNQMRAMRQGSTNSVPASIAPPNQMRPRGVYASQSSKANQKQFSRFTSTNQMPPRPSPTAFNASSLDQSRSSPLVSRGQRSPATDQRRHSANQQLPAGFQKPSPLRHQSRGFEKRKPNILRKSPTTKPTFAIATPPTGTKSPWSSRAYPLPSPTDTEPPAKKARALSPPRAHQHHFKFHPYLPNQRPASSHVDQQGANDMPLELTAKPRKVFLSPVRTSLMTLPPSMTSSDASEQPLCLIVKK